MIMLVSNKYTSTGKFKSATILISIFVFIVAEQKLTCSQMIQCVI